VVIPKPGKDDYHECSAYRTISITSCLRKRFEYISSMRLASALRYIDFDADQFAYLQSRSATQAILTTVETIKKGLLTGHYAGAVFFDFTDAFGSVNRSSLLNKIRRDFGISGRLYWHISSFLSNRMARIKIQHDIGEWMESVIGTSAGTRLGPLLFIMHVHDVPKCIRPKFAGDLVAVSVARDIDVIQSSLQEDTDQLVCWAKHEGMTINSAKTKVMLFGGKNDTLQIKIDNTELENVRSFKYLGVVLDPMLDFSIQADYAAGKAKRASFKISTMIKMIKCAEWY